MTVYNEIQSLFLKRNLSYLGFSALVILLGFIFDSNVILLSVLIIISCPSLYFCIKYDNKIQNIVKDKFNQLDDTEIKKLIGFCLEKRDYHLIKEINKYICKNGRKIAV